MTFQSWEDPPPDMDRQQPRFRPLGPEPDPEPEFEPEPEPRRLTRGALIWGVAIACVLGLGLGVIAKPELIGRGPEPAAMQPRPATAEGQIDIVMAAPPPEPPVPASPPLETMSPDLVEAASRPPTAAPPRTSPPPPASRPAPTRPVRDASQSAIDANVRVPEPVRPPEPVRLARPSFDCRRASTQAEDMVCADPALAAADRQLERAFQRALRAGAPYDELRGEQDDWLEIREDAARRSPRAVASVYDQRIEELNALADEAGRRW